MQVTCPNCGGSHPKWECKAKADQIAAWQAKKSVGGVAQRDTGDSRKVKTADVATRSDRPNPGDGAGSVAQIPRIEGTKFVAEVPEGTQLVVYGNHVLAAGPNLRPSIVTKDGLVPLTVPVSEIKTGGRPRLHPDRKAYKAEKERDRRARKRAEAQGK